MKLGTLLLRNAVISLSQLEAALRSQVLYGGRLGTNLIELGHVDVDTLAEYLAEVLDIPQATPEMFEAVEQSVIDGFGAELARHYLAFPLGYFDEKPEVLAVAVVEPNNDALLNKLAESAGRPITPYVAPELRLYYYLEKHYGISRKARYVRTGSGNPPAGERRRVQPAGGIAMPPSVRLEPRAGAGSSPSIPTAPAAAPPAPQSTRRTASQNQGDGPGTALSYRDACAALDSAARREAIGDVLIQYAIGWFDAAVVFLVRDANAVGWRAYTVERGIEFPDIEQLSLPLGGASILQAAHDTGALYRGSAQSAGRPVERELWSSLGITTPPHEMMVVPVIVRQRVINLIYAHGLNGGAIDETAAKKLAELARRAARAYTRLLHTTKQSARMD